MEAMIEMASHHEPHSSGYVEALNGLEGLENPLIHLQDQFLESASVLLRLAAILLVVQWSLGSE